MNMIDVMCLLNWYVQQASQSSLAMVAYLASAAQPADPQHLLSCRDKV